MQRPQTKTYRVSRWIAVYYVLSYIAFVVFAMFVVIPMWRGLPRESFVFWFTTVWLVGVLWVLYVFLTTPYRIHLEGDKFRFESLLRQTEIDAGSIRSISRGSFTMYVVTIRHSTGKFNLPTQIEGLYELLWTIKELNPSVQIRGL